MDSPRFAPVDRMSRQDLRLELHQIRLIRKSLPPPRPRVWNMRIKEILKRLTQLGDQRRAERLARQSMVADASDS